MIFDRLSPRFIKAWENTILEFSTFSPHKIAHSDPSQLIKTLAREDKKNLYELREIFNEDRENISGKLLATRPYLMTYLLGFHLANAFRLTSTFRRIEERYILPKLWESTAFQSLNIWDLGCGSGAMSQLLSERLSQHFPATRVYLYDSNTLLLNASKHFFSELNLPNVKLFPRKVPLDDLNTAPDTHSDELNVISLGYVWNELTKNPRAQKRIKDLLAHFAQRKTPTLIVLLEPAQSFASRVAMRFRDELTERGFKLLYPCPHSLECPMRLRSKDWCYSEFSLDTFPKEARYVDQVTHLKRSHMASSAFVFASSDLHSMLESHKKQTGSSVVVGRPQTTQEEDRAFKYLLCDEEGILQDSEQEFEQGDPRILSRGAFF